MKKSKVLTTPTRLSDLSYEEFYDDDEMSLRAERINIRKLRQFKHDSTS